jgi:hypothetical protein
MLLINVKVDILKQNRCVEEKAWKEALYLRTLMYFVHFWQFTPCGLFKKTEMLLKIPVFLSFLVFWRIVQTFRRTWVLLDPEYKDSTIIQIVGTYLHRHIPETGICSVISMLVPVVKFQIGWFDIPRSLKFSLSFIQKIVTCLSSWPSGLEKKPRPAILVNKFFIA